MLKMNNKVTKETWDKHWFAKNEIKNLIFERSVSFYRKYLTGTQVCTHVNRYFSKKGIFLEMGSGTCESSYRVSKQDRSLGAVDISEYALLRARSTSKMDFFIQADIFKLPLKNSSIDGIWNVGVMEHFSKEDLIKILNEFNRVLKKNSYCILFWPWTIAPSHIIFSSYEKIFRIVGIYKQVFPRATSMFKHRKSIENMLKVAGFSNVTFHLPLFDFTHVVVVGHKL